MEYDQSPILTIGPPARATVTGLVALVPAARRSRVPTTGMRVHALGKGVLLEMSQSDAVSMLAPTKPRAKLMRPDCIASLFATKANSAPRANSQARVIGL